MEQRQSQEQQGQEQQDRDRAWALEARELLRHNDAALGRARELLGQQQARINEAKGKVQGFHRLAGVALPITVMGVAASWTGLWGLGIWGTRAALLVGMLGWYMVLASSASWLAGSPPKRSSEDTSPAERGD